MYLSALLYLGRLEEVPCVHSEPQELSAHCGRWVGHETPTLFYLAIFGSIVSYIYSAPPLKLKQSGWIGNYALGSSYIALPWLAGQVSLIRRHDHARMSAYP
jgi:hypothetical protein